MFYMTIGTGIGGGIVRDERIVALSDRGEAEIGHIVVEPDGPQCCCGGRGCVESLCSGPGIAQLGARMAEREGRPLGEPATSKRFMEQWQEGDDFARRVVEQAAAYLAIAVAAAVNLIAPEVFVVGGGVGAGNPRFLELIDEKTHPRVAPYFREHYRLVRCELEENVVAQGAAILARQSVG
jgi:glucokinase